MQNQRGNFLLQVLLALTLVFSFMPFMAKRLANRDTATQMYSAKQTIETIYNAARLFVYDQKEKLNYPADGSALVFSGEELIKELEPYGVPAIGFNPQTSMGQDVTLEIKKEEKKVQLCEQYWEEGKPCDDTAVTIISVYTANLVISGGDLKEYQVAELARMIGAFAKRNEKTITIAVSGESMYTDVVLRKEPNNQVGFLTELRMDGCECKPDDCKCPELDCKCCACDIDAVGNLFAENGVFQIAQFYNLSVGGGGRIVNNDPTKKIVSAGDKENLSTNLITNKLVFAKPEKSDTALAVNSHLQIGDENNSGIVDAGGVIAMDGDKLPNLSVMGSIITSAFSLIDGASVNKDGLHADSEDAAKKCVWTVGGSLQRGKRGVVSLMANSLFDMNGVFYGTSAIDLDRINFSEKSGVHSDATMSEKVLVRGASLLELQKNIDSGAVEIEIDLQKVSRIPDIIISDMSIPKGNPIIVDPTMCEKEPTLTSCDKYISVTDNSSLVDIIVCGYIYWSRLERAINVQLCQIAGGRCCP